jgi:ribosomal protein S18 acetylase RimI-like enzyme
LQALLSPLLSRPHGAGNVICAAKCDPVLIRPIGQESLPDMVKVHMAAFAGSALTTLGINAVHRYYEWQLIGPHELTALGAFVDKRMVGFALGGVFRGALSGFLAKNRSFLVSRVLSHPWLLMNPIVRGRLSAGWKGLLCSTRRSNSAIHSKGPELRPFGILVIAVARQYQGQGIGKLLMKRAEEIARRLSFHEMRLSVQPDNQQALGFYESLLWKKISKNDEWNGEMRKALSSECQRKAAS